MAYKSKAESVAERRDLVLQLCDLDDVIDTIQIVGLPILGPPTVYKFGSKWK
jgi:hypothetical protein